MKQQRKRKQGETDADAPGSHEENSASAVDSDAAPEGSTKSPKAATDKPEGAPPTEMVTIVKTANAAKLSPRGDGALTYQIGRIGEAVYIRIFHNESAGRFSKEWVSAGAIRAALAKLTKGGALFKAALGMREAWKGQSACNSGFGSAILKAEGVLASDAEKKGMMRLASPTALDDWERAMQAIKAPKDAEKVPLHPPKQSPPIPKKSRNKGPVVAEGTSTPAGDQTEENNLREDVPTETGEGGTPPSSRADGLPELEHE